MARTKVFIDSNIWFSALYKPSKASQLINRLIKSDCQIVISQLVLDEITTNIQLKLPRLLPRLAEFLSQCRLKIIKNPLPEELKKYSSLAHKKDLPIIIAAINYQCQYFITGNIKDFKISLINKNSGLEVLGLTPALTIL